MSDSIETSEAMARPWTPRAKSEGTASAMRMLPVDEQLLHCCPAHPRFLLSDGRPALGLVGGGHERPFSAEERAAISARLVATWNACQGISTETLRLVPRFTEAGVKTVQAVEAQRDTLLAALVFSRKFIHTDRTSFADEAMRPDGTMAELDAEEVGYYDEALRVIDSAMAAAGSAS